MAQTGYTPISLYYSTTAAAAPTAGNLVAGELALNTQDEKLYFKNAAGTVKLLASSAGASGDVVGPASATDNAIPTYDGTTGKLIKNNSGATISSGTITATGFSGPLNGTVGATTPNTGAFTTLSASGVATFSAGSAAAPAITTSGDTNTGIFFPAADTIAFTEGGAEAMRIDSSGNVGIGTSSPSATDRLTIGDGAVANNASISINGGSNNARGTGIKFSKAGTAVGFIGSASWLEGGTSDALAFSANSSATVAMRIDSSGSVGIGTSSLTGYSLRVGKTVTGAVDSVGVLSNGLVQSDVTSSAAQLQAQIALAASAFTLTSAFGLYVGQSALSGGAAITSQYGVYVANSLTGATNNYGFYSNIASSANRYNFYANGTADNYFAGNVGIGQTAPGESLHTYSASTTRARFQNANGSFYVGNEANDAVLTMAQAYNMVFKTSNTERMRIDSSGNVGIGTSSPNAKLELAANNTGITTGAALNTLRFYDTDTSSAADQPFGAIEWYGADTSNTTIRAFMRVSAESATVPSYMSFGTATAAGSATERLRITSSGNVGIGTTAPTLPLTVDGEISTLFDNNGTALEATAVFIGNGNSASTATHARVAIIGSTTGTVGELYFTNRGVGSYNSFGCGIRGGYAGADARNNTLTFFTSHTTDENVERVRIESTGNVGIGTSSPGVKLDVVGQIRATDTIFSNGGFSGQGAYVERNSTGGGKLGSLLSSGSVTFETNSTERMRIDSSGNVGIGTTSAYNSAKLSVNGDLEARGNIKSYYSSVGGISNGATQNIMTLPAGSYGSPLSGMLNIQQRNDNTGNLTMSTYLVSAWGGAGAVFTAVSTINYGSGSSFSITASTSGGDLTIYITNTSGATSTSINFSFMRLAGTAPTYAF